ncbi:MAG: hypothetical protein WAV50_00175 [Minisyncoccia bacterium]
MTNLNDSGLGKAINNLPEKTRGLITFGAVVLMIIFLSSVGGSDSPKPAPTTSNVSSWSASQAVQPVTLDQQITQKITDTLGATTNMSKPRVVKVEITPYSATELKMYGYKATDKIQSAFIIINSSENMTTNLQKGSMDGEATKVFQSVFTASPTIGDIVLWSQLPVQDKYGNTKDDTAIVFSMGRPLYQKVNWTGFDHRSLPDLLKSEWASDDRNAYSELIKF